VRWQNYSSFAGWLLCVGFVCLQMCCNCVLAFLVFQSYWMSNRSRVPSKGYLQHLYLFYCRLLPNIIYALKLKQLLLSIFNCFLQRAIFSLRLSLKRFFVSTNLCHFFSPMGFCHNRNTYRHGPTGKLYI